MPGIVDGHHHLWDLERSPQPWLTASFAPIARSFVPDELEPLLRAAGVDRTILVQSSCSDAGTDELFDYAATRPWIGAVVAWIDLASPAHARTRLDALAHHATLRGVRHLIHTEADPHWIVRPHVRESIALLEQRGLVLELPVVFPQHLDDVPVLARSFPSLTIVIDHLGKPPIGRSAMGVWALRLRRAAAHPNVAAKVSGLNTCLATQDWIGEDLRLPIEIAVDCFGPDRLLFGSDWPVSLLNGSYAKVVEETRRALEGAGSATAGAILGDTAHRLYRLAEACGGATNRTIREGEA